MIAAGGHSHGDALMGALVVVDLAPLVERLLRLGQPGQRGESEDLGLEAAVEAFVFAAALGMVGPGVDGFAAEFQEPDLEQRPLAGAARSDESRVGKACVSTCSSRWSPSH